MPITKKSLWTPLVLLVVFSTLLYLCYPIILYQILKWQGIFSQLISNYLDQIKTQKQYAGWLLIWTSFLYGVFHSVGPGHGKFIMTSYLSANDVQLKKGIRLTLLASLFQGIVAVVMTSIIIVVLTLSSYYFKLTQVWLERISFSLIMGLGIYWLLINLKKLWLLYRPKARVKPKIFKIMSMDSHNIHASVKFDIRSDVDTQGHCGCGHQHIPTSRQLSSTNDWKSELMIILSIGMRPCSGGILVLFLSYMLDLYQWGVIATMAMAVGSGITLSILAILVLYARSRIVKLGHWYFSPALLNNIAIWIKLAFGVFLIVIGASLLYSTTLPVVGGASLFVR